MTKPRYSQDSIQRALTHHEVLHTIQLLAPGRTRWSVDVDGEWLTMTNSQVHAFALGLATAERRAARAAARAEPLADCPSCGAGYGEMGHAAEPCLSEPCPRP